MVCKKMILQFYRFAESTDFTGITADDAFTYDEKTRSNKFVVVRLLLHFTIKNLADFGDEKS
jgi:hypothetical protein